ncbi:hypothetical protein P7K49_002375, partial [Saguinus oedipus]
MLIRAGGLGNQVQAWLFRCAMCRKRETALLPPGGHRQGSLRPVGEATATASLPTSSEYP